MNSITDKNFRECPICLDLPVKVSLNCPKKHQLCLSCAIKIFGEMVNEQVKLPKPCCLCTRLITAHTDISLFHTKGDGKQQDKTSSLAKIVGLGPMDRELWGYIKKHNLQDPKNKRMIVPNAALAEVLGSSRPIDIFKMRRKILDLYKA